MKKNRHLLVYLFLTLGLIGAIFLALTRGAVNLNFLDLSPVEKDIFLYVRVPRVLLAVLVGGALVLSGILFQYVMQNPLADSFTTGASASAALGAVIAIFFGLTHFILPFALGFTLLGLAIVYRIASYQGRLLPITMLLAGIVISTFSSATISLLKYLSDDSVSSIVFWLMGGFQNASYAKIVLLVVTLLLVTFSLYRRALMLDLISFDEATAISSGVPVYRLRKELLFYGALLTTFAVAFSGIIGFVGLIVPHILRLLGFSQAKKIILTGLFSGAIFMVLADLLSRTILPQGEELPVGILTSSIGGLFFLYLLVKRRKSLYEFD
ncbi:FecCD family ABC transporter permease [Thermodesulfatator indicus]